MSLIEIILLGISLSMDAFAVSIATGISLKDLRFRHAAKVGLFFGGFQFLMPVLGYWAGSQVSSYIESFDHWIAFGLLAIIGGKMLIESIRPNEKEEYVDPTATGKLFILAIATSIDALAIGITFSCIPVVITRALSRTANTLLACLLIACTTFLISVGGVKIGNVFGTRYQKKAEITGGIILICLGIKILIEHF